MKNVFRRLGEINVNNVKSRLLKLPTLNSLSSCNLAVLMNEFNEESEIHEVRLSLISGLY